MVQSGRTTSDNVYVGHNVWIEWKKQVRTPKARVFSRKVTMPHSEHSAIVAEEDLVAAVLREPKCKGTFFRGDEAPTGLEETMENQDWEATPPIGAWTVAGVDDTIHASTKISLLHHK
jgi:hypothetical protein